MNDLFTGLNASFEDILGKKANVFTEKQRRTRWAAWLRTARKMPESKRVAKYWMGHECHGCVHRKGSWCGLMGLPCTVNPILSFRHGMIGMACMGAGREEAEADNA